MDEDNFAQCMVTDELSQYSLWGKNDYKRCVCNSYGGDGDCMGTISLEPFLACLIWLSFFWFFVCGFALFPICRPHAHGIASMLFYVSVFFAGVLEITVLFVNGHFPEISGWIFAIIIFWTMFSNFAMTCVCYVYL